MTGPLLFERVEVAGRPGQYVLVADGRVRSVSGTRPQGVQRATVVDGAGGALLTGLNDHHLHLFATAAATAPGAVSLDREDVRDAADVAATLRSAAAVAGPGGWVRATGYDDDRAGPLTAPVLDRMLGDLADRPVRVQHRSGHAWILNSAAMRLLGVAPPDGVLLDADDILRGTPGDGFPALAGLSRRLAAYGITGVTDAGVNNGPAELAELRRAAHAGELAQRCLVMGGPGLDGRRPTGRVTVGPRKIVLADHRLPALDELVGEIRAAGERGVAVHAVTLESLLLAVTAMSVAGGPDRTVRHRIEHGSVAPPPAVAAVARAGARVVTQPGFVPAHGDRYLRTVDPADLPWMYRLRGWLDAGVPVAAGSDAPYGPVDPWAVMRAAVGRRTGEGRPFGPGEALSPEEALCLFTAPLADPGGPTGSGPVPGDPADLCLLRVNWAQARRELTAGLVAATFVAGRSVRTD
ncbi:hypothetical protein HY68_33665 [Streptomyces sp. AcH 505]|uniref:amidohydrolase family protein n=1 Tax=Streptomyces sp. AcH 505 TaxID=352211 RepID=UPI000591B724|nr:hypothetical protein HY68_33665 [Streptomyces sp. AcH 505]